MFAKSFTFEQNFKKLFVAEVYSKVPQILNTS